MGETIATAQPEQTQREFLDLAQMRRRASLGFCISLWLLIPIVFVIARSNGVPTVPVGLTVLIAAVVATWSWRLGNGRLWSRLSSAAALTFGPICLVWAGSGAWQIDYHMTFFVVFAALVAYVDWRPIAVSAALTAVHHLILDIVARDVVFPEEGLGRVALHGAVVAVECGVLFWIVAQMRRLFSEARVSMGNAEAALDALRLFESAIAKANDSILIAENKNLSDRRFRIMYANPALETLAGYAAGELIGKTTDVLRGPLTDLERLALLIDGARAGAGRVAELTYYTRDGQAIPCETSMHAIFDGSGEVSHMVSVARDITVRKAAEAALLEARIAQETNSALRREIARREGVEAELAHAAFHDRLTGLANRVLFCDRLDHAVKRSHQRGSRHVAVMFLDCDRFKFVNDSFGHTTGDLLLTALAQRLEAALRPGDTLARLGGDEFTLLFEDIVDEAEAATLADRILQTLSAPFSLAGQELFVTASVGIALNVRGDETGDELLRNADIAMYRAKSDGRRRYQLFRPELADRAERRFQLEIALRTAIERGELSIAYQSIVRLNTDEIDGFEALLRWSHPPLGSIPPDEFIPIAEETGLIGPIGAWVMREACSQLRTWQSSIDGAADLTMNVNVSAAQLLDDTFVATTAQALRDSGIAPHTLHVEITESVLMREPDRACAVLSELRALGVELHLDDFGTGYSSLSYLHRFPLHALKIDRSFVSGGGAGLANPKIVETVIALARQLGLEVTAEGIETVEQERQLRALACTKAQGYLFARPQNAGASAELLSLAHLPA